MSYSMFLIQKNQTPTAKQINKQSVTKPVVKFNYCSPAQSPTVAVVQQNVVSSPFQKIMFNYNTKFSQIYEPPKAQSITYQYPKIQLNGQSIFRIQNPKINFNWQARDVHYDIKSLGNTIELKPIKIGSSSHDSSRVEVKHKRKHIFSSQQRKRKPIFAARSRSGTDIREYVHEMGRCQHPKSVISYVDLSPLRNKKTVASKPELITIDATKKELKSRSKPSSYKGQQIKKLSSPQQQFQQLIKKQSPVKIDLDYESEDLQTNKSNINTEVDQYFLQSGRFYDKNNNTANQKVMYSDVTLRNTLNHDFKHFSQDSLRNQPKTSMFLTQLSEIWQRIAGHNYALPLLLILFGLLLFVIQATK